MSTQRLQLGQLPEPPERSDLVVAQPVAKTRPSINNASPLANNEARFLVIANSPSMEQKVQQQELTAAWVVHLLVELLSTIAFRAASWATLAFKSATIASVRPGLAIALVRQPAQHKKTGSFPTITLTGVPITPNRFLIMTGQ